MKPVTYYAQEHELIHEMVGQYGSRFENLDRQWKLVFRAALASYLAVRPIWIDAENSITCMDCSIVSAGGDDLNIWDENPQLVSFIQDCDALPESDIEGLIEALTIQLKYER